MEPQNEEAASSIVQKVGRVKVCENRKYKLIEILF